SGPEGLLLYHDLDVVLVRAGAAGRSDDDEALECERSRGLDDPVDQALAEQRMQMLRRLRAHAGSETPGHYHGCDGKRHQDASVMAGAPGFEPGITGPKPVALPLGHAPARGEV